MNTLFVLKNSPKRLYLKKFQWTTKLKTTIEKGFISQGALHFYRMQDLVLHKQAPSLDSMISSLPTALWYLKEPDKNTP